MIVGIDPDIDKSGIATLCDDGEGLQLNNLSFIHVMDFVRLHKDEIKCVYIEAGWFNKKSNWHAASNINKAAKIGKNVGMNHAAGMLLEQSIKHEGINVILVRPTKSKLSAEQFLKLTGYKGRTNQEARDAAMMIFGRN